MMARAVLDGIRARLAAATPGPLKVAISGDRKWALVLANSGTADEFRVAQCADDDNAEFFAAAPATVARLTAALELVLTAAEGRAHTLRHTADRLNQQCLDRNPDRDYDAAIRYEHYALEAESTHIRITTLIEKALTD
jgi:hypothetical protein